MAKGDILTIEEAASYRPNPELLRYIFRSGDKGGVGTKPLRVLDWGCGRGRLVLTLLRRGVDCYGVEIDAKTIANAGDAFRSEGHDPEQRLRAIDSRLRTNFPDGFFDVVVSDNVLEHVADLENTLAEIARLTRPGGWGFHLFPARFTPIEGHLFMPFVHWLPKNGMRKLLIRLFVAIGIEPRWPQAQGRSTGEKADLYYRYSRDKTFYRAPTDILRVCQRLGFMPKLVARSHPRFESHHLLRLLARGIGGVAVNRLLSEFKAVELLVDKPEQ